PHTHHSPSFPTRRSSDLNLPEIAQTLGVAFVLEGSVRQSGQKVSITAQLSDARSGVLAWEESYERNLADIFAIQSDIVQRIISQDRKSTRLNSSHVAISY